MVGPHPSGCEVVGILPVFCPFLPSPGLQSFATLASVVSSFQSARSRSFGFSVIGGLLGPWPRAEPERGCLSSWPVAVCPGQPLGFAGLQRFMSLLSKGRGPKAWGVAHWAVQAPPSVADTPRVQRRAYTYVTRHHSPPDTPRPRGLAPQFPAIPPIFAGGAPCAPPPSLPLKRGSDGGLSPRLLCRCHGPQGASQRHWGGSRPPSPAPRLTAAPGGRGPCPILGCARDRHPQGRCTPWRAYRAA